jgi:hypothetical protein
VVDLKIKDCWWWVKVVDLQIKDCFGKKRLEDIPTLLNPLPINPLFNLSQYPKIQSLITINKTE